MTRHRLLERQIRRAKLGPVEGPFAELLALVEGSYVEFDQERKRESHANQLLSEEVRELNAGIRGDAEGRVRALLDAVSDGVIIVDGHGNVDAFNSGAAAIFGVAAVDVVGWPLALLGPIGVLASGGRVIKRNDGSEVDVDVTVSEALLGPRRVKITIVRDVTAHMRAERELREAMTRATAASRAKSDFLATMSHEIRTPMNGVLGMVGLLLDGALERGQRSYAEAIRDSGEALLAILNDILDFSKIEAGHMTFEEYDFAPTGLVESVVELLAPRALAKSIELAIVVGPGVASQMRGDAGRLRQILMNLVGNALKFTETGGVVVEVAAQVNAAGAHVLRVDVVDTGIGIDASVLPALFSEFVQADASTTRRFGGTGLGLAISRRLCELMGGAMGVESTKGVGSRFWFSLPLPLAASPAGGPPASLLGLRCLVVDDNPLNRQVFERQLAPWGVAVTSVSSADLALAALVKAVALGRAFDVAIVDYQMPDMSGKELGTVIRATPSLASLHLIMATSGMGDEDLRDFDDVFHKPVRPSALLRALTRHGSSEAAHSTAPPPVPPPRALAARRLRILLVEDNFINQKVAVGYLEKAGHRVDVASNGLEAISAVRAFPYEVVLMDMQMPEMDGLEATRAIRALVGDSELESLFDVFNRSILQLTQDLPTLGDSALRARAHQIRGSAGELGFPGLRDAAGAVDNRLGAGGDARDLVPHLAEMLQEAVRALSAIRCPAAAE